MRGIARNYDFMRRKKNPSHITNVEQIIKFCERNTLHTIFSFFKREYFYSEQNLYLLHIQINIACF